MRVAVKFHALSFFCTTCYTLGVISFPLYFVLYNFGFLNYPNFSSYFFRGIMGSQNLSFLQDNKERKRKGQRNNQTMVFGNGLMLFWFKDLMNATEKLQLVDPKFRHFCLVPSSAIRSPLMKALDRSVETLGL